MKLLYKICNTEHNTQGSYLNKQNSFLDAKNECFTVIFIYLFSLMSIVYKKEGYNAHFKMTHSAFFFNLSILFTYLL